MAATHHDRFVREDYERVRSFGMRTVREGLRWPVIQTASGHCDFTSVYPFLAAAKENEIEIVWDLLHFGWPDHLDIFSPAWVDAFTELAFGFAQVLLAQGWESPFIAPVNEPSFVAWGGGDVAYINPFATGRGNELKRQLVKGAIAATHAVRSVLPRAIMVAPDPVIHFVGDPGIPGEVERAREYTSSMFEAWDMLTGRLHPELGGADNCVDVIGVNFYDRNERWLAGRTIRHDEPEYRAFRLILQEVYERYRRPVFVAETGSEDEARAPWFAYIAKEVRAAVESGVPVQGICLYPILNHPGWDDDRHCFNGLWDYASTSGEREIYEPLAEEIHRQETIGLLEGELWLANR